MKETPRKFAARVGRERAQELRDGAPLRTTLTDRDDAILWLEFLANLIDPPAPTSTEGEQ